jgi:hypothetical protein
MRPKGSPLKRFLGLRGQNERKIPFQGGVDTLQPGQMSGWVVAPDVPFHEVRLLVGTHLIARGEINQARQDVCETLGWQGLPGFSVELPSELPVVNWQGSPRVIALSADGSQQVELRLIGRRQQTAEVLKALLQSDLLGLKGHCDGLAKGSIWGWACRRGQQRAAQIWLQAAGKEPIPVTCHLHRDGLQAINLPSHSGFVVDTNSLPRDWAGEEVWFSFDQQAQFSLPQQERIVLPAGPNVGVGVVHAIPANDSLKVVKKPPTQEWLPGVPEDLQQHWQALEHFRLYLDSFEQELEALDKRRKQMPAPKISALPGWWPRLLGGGR